MPHPPACSTGRPLAAGTPGHRTRSSILGCSLLVSGLVVSGCASPPERTAASDRAAVTAIEDAARVSPPRGYGAVRGRVLPEGVESMIRLHPEGDSARDRTHTFSDPTTGEFVAEDLPTSVYRVEVRPLDPMFEARVFSGIVVPWDGVSDLGTVDLRAGAEGPGEKKPDPARPDP